MSNVYIYEIIIKTVIQHKTHHFSWLNSPHSSAVGAVFRFIKQYLMYDLYVISWVRLDGQ